MDFLLYHVSNSLFSYFIELPYPPPLIDMNYCKFQQSRMEEKRTQACVIRQDLTGCIL